MYLSTLLLYIPWVLTEELLLLFAGCSLTYNARHPPDVLGLFLMSPPSSSKPREVNKSSTQPHPLGRSADWPQLCAGFMQDQGLFFRLRDQPRQTDRGDCHWPTNSLPAQLINLSSFSCALARRPPLIPAKATHTGPAWFETNVAE